MFVLTLLTSMMLGFAGVALVLSSFRAHWQVSRRCSHCGYDLHSHTPGERCPECGGVIGEFPDGYIERRPERLIIGLCLLALALLAFIGFIALLLGGL